MMRENMIKLGLGPILLAQGLYVRRTTPILAEAAGPRSGERGSGEELRLLIVGDSAAAGVGVARQDEALAGRLVAQLAEDYQVVWELHARSGWSTADLLAHLDTMPGTPFDAVVTSLGVNDVLESVAPNKWRRSQLELIEVLREKFDKPRILLTHVPPMHHFPRLPQPLRWFLGRAARRLNHELIQLSAPLADCAAVAVDFPLSEDMMAADGFHPGAPGYKLWADEVARLIRGGAAMI